MDKGIKFDFWFICRIVIFVLFALFLMYPFITLFSKSVIGSDGNITLENFATFFQYEYYYSTLMRSLTVSVLTTVFAVIIGVPLAYAFSRYKIYGSKIINVMIIMSLMSPPFIGAYSWIMLLGRNGVITKGLNVLGINFPSIYGFLGIILVFTVTFPVIKPTIFAGAIMVFMSSLADFGTPMLIGEGYKVLPVMVYEEYMSETGGNAGMASALSIIIVLCSLTVLLIQKFIVSRKNYTMSALRPPSKKDLPKPKKIALSLLLFVFAFITFLPQVVVIVTSFINTNGPVFTEGFGLESYKSIFFKLGHNIVNTFTFSTIAIFVIILLSVLIAFLITKRRGKSATIMDILVMFPYVIPGAVLGISLLITYNKGPILIAGTPLILIIAYIIRKMPYTVRSSSAILQQIDSSVEEASISLGETPMKSFFKVTVRIMMPGIVSGAILSWISTINELSSSIMLYTGKTATISVAIYTEVVRASFGTAAALASILTVATLLSFVLFNIISKGKVSVV